MGPPDRAGEGACIGHLKGTGLDHGLGKKTAPWGRVQSRGGHCGNPAAEKMHFKNHFLKYLSSFPSSPAATLPDLETSQNSLGPFLPSPA